MSNAADGKLPRVDLELEVCNLGELVDACEVIRTYTLAARPDCVLITSKKFNRIWLTVSTQTLSDGSQVYMVEVH